MLFTLCVQIAFRVRTRLIKAREICSDDVAVNRGVFRDDDEESILLVVVDELIE
jgi:hypothetical protein